MENINNGSDETDGTLAMFAAAFLAFLPSILLALSIDIAGGVDYLHHSLDPKGSREGIALTIAFGGWFVMGAIISWSFSRPETEKISGAILKMFKVFNVTMWPAITGMLMTAMLAIPMLYFATQGLEAHLGKLAALLLLTAVSCGVWGWQKFVRA